MLVVAALYTSQLCEGLLRGGAGGAEDEAEVHPVRAVPLLFRCKKTQITCQILDMCAAAYSARHLCTHETNISGEMFRYGVTLLPAETFKSSVHCKTGSLRLKERTRRAGCY